MGLFGRTATTVGLDIGSGLIKLVVISHASGGPVLTKVAFTSIGHDAIVEGEIMDPGIGDLKDREVWGEFTKAYRAALTKCSTDGAPWYVVPSDNEEVRNLLVARTIADTLDDMNLRYPTLDPALKELTIK